MKISCYSDFGLLLPDDDIGFIVIGSELLYQLVNILLRFMFAFELHIGINFLLVLLFFFTHGLVCRFLDVVLVE